MKDDNIKVCCLAGGIASLVTELFYYPLDTIKTRLQASTKKINYMKQQKIRLFQGMSTMTIVGVPQGMLFFLVYEYSKSRLETQLGDKPINHLIAASCAEIGANFLRNPFEVTKQQMQIGLNNKVQQTVHEIYLINGFRGYYAGYLSLIMREIPFSAIQFPIYEYLNKRSIDRKGGQECSFVDNCANGAIAGSIAAGLTTPIDVVKTKLMVQRQKVYDNIWDCMSKIYHEDGLRGFFRGFTIRVPMLGITGTVFFLSYEQSKRAIRKIVN